MTPIFSPVELPGGWHQMYLVAGEAEARQIAGERESYLFDSKIVDGLYLFIPQIPFTDDDLPLTLEISELEWMRQ